MFLLLKFGIVDLRSFFIGCVMQGILNLVFEIIYQARKSLLHISGTEIPCIFCLCKKSRQKSFCSALEPVNNGRIILLVLQKVFMASFRRLKCELNMYFEYWQIHSIEKW